MRSTKLSLEAKYLTGEIPISNEILQGILDETGFDSNNLSIRETNRLATLISEKGDVLLRLNPSLFFTHHYL